MAGEWLKVPAGDLFSYIAKGIPPVYAESNSDNAICVLNQKCNRNFEISFEDSRLHDISKRDVPREKILKENDIIINSTGKGTAGRVAQIFDIDFPITVDGHMIIIRANEKIDPWYLGYALKMQQPLIEQLAEGSTGQTELNRQRLSSEILVDYPKDLHEQRIIAELFFAIDSRLYVNRMISDHLEEIARAIFKHWFIDFEFPNENGDPYKSSGGEMIDSPLGPIPKRWRVGNISDIANILGGGTPRTSIDEYWIGDIPFFTPKDAKALYCIHTEKCLTKKGLQSCSSRLYEKNTVFITARGTVGKLVLAGTPMAMNQSCYALIGKEVSQNFLYLAIDNLVDSLKQSSHGAVFSTITTATLESTKVLIPEASVERDFRGRIASFFETMLTNDEENGKLSELRDSLLPKLMSGEIRIPVSEKEDDQL